MIVVDDTIARVVDWLSGFQYMGHWEAAILWRFCDSN